MKNEPANKTVKKRHKLPNHVPHSAFSFFEYKLTHDTTIMKGNYILNNAEAYLRITSTEADNS